MRFLLITVVIFFTFSSAISQSLVSPNNLKHGKCYSRAFYYEKPIELKEIDCNNSNGKQSSGIQVYDVRKTDIEKAKFIAYQKELLDLGYKLKANGFIDNQTIKAHHKYLKFKKKQERKAKRKNRKAL
ncbi:hypothetical protein [Lacinutrix jangbogonensis]|uniref:hypothetical protein n=1 Tax=Lacinutrix jangbogonensis TaxID=1469557 RepID=UPI00053EA02D|nr:hypothetical protein [Lacinutrix jangbogonensis]